MLLPVTTKKNLAPATLADTWAPRREARAAEAEEEKMIRFATGLIDHGESPLLEQNSLPGLDWISRASALIKD